MQASFGGSLGGNAAADADWATARSAFAQALTQPGDTPRAALDVGCDDGNHLFMLDAALGNPEDVILHGVDLSDHGLPYAQAFAESLPGFSNCRFQQTDLTQGLPLSDGSFRVVSLADVLEPLEDPVSALRELARVTSLAGTVLVSTPVRNSLFKRAAATANRLSRGSLYRSYYTGKEVTLDEAGHPEMHVDAGHEHISEMTVPELLAVGRRAGL